MRLIDADALIEELREIKTLYGVPITKRDEQMVHWVIGHINNQPTAFDVEKVIEQLEEEREYSYADFEEYVESYGLDLSEYDDWYYQGLKRAITLAKRGIVKCAMKSFQKR